MATINGKSFDQIVSELEADFPKEYVQYLDDGKPYYPREAYVSRMNTVIGVLNYDFCTSDPILVQNGRQQNFIVRGTIRIYDDDRNLVVEKSCAGASNIIYKNIVDANGKKNSGDIPAKVSNDVEAACIDAFKRCCKLFGVGIMKKTVRTNNSSSPKGSVSFMEPIIKNAFSTFNKNALKATVNYNNKTYPLIIWGEQVQEIKNRCSLEKFLSAYIPGKTFKFYGYVQQYNGQEQIVLSRLYIKENDGAEQK